MARFFDGLHPSEAAAAAGPSDGEGGKWTSRSSGDMPFQRSKSALAFSWPARLVVPRLLDKFVHLAPHLGEARHDLLALGVRDRRPRRLHEELVAAQGLLGFVGSRAGFFFLLAWRRSVPWRRGRRGSPAPCGRGSGLAAAWRARP